MCRANPEDGTPTMTSPTITAITRRLDTALQGPSEIVFFMAFLLVLLDNRLFQPSPLTTAVHQDIRKKFVDFALWLEFFGQNFEFVPCEKEKVRFALEVVIEMV